LLHKSDPYGTILLKQNDKLTKNFALNFAIKITRLLPIDRDTLYSAISQLIDEGCLTIDGDRLFQKRMVRDNEISELRSEAGSKGGKKTQQFAKAKSKANTEYENEYENNNKDKGGMGEKDRREFSEEVKELYRSTVILFDEKTRPKTQSQIDSWHDTLDKCIRLDGYSADQIRDIVKRMRMDDWWRTNFMSIIKLRNLNKEKIKYIDVFAARLKKPSRTAFGIDSKERNYQEQEKTF
jgi:hypothetical protein